MPDFDYSSNGAYFVTVCVKDMQCVLSSVTVGVGALDDPKIKLTETGIIVENEIKKMNAVYNEIQVNHYCIMPNHIHLIIEIQNDSLNGSSGAPTPTNSAVARYVSTLKRFVNKKTKTKLWQRGYHDHIIRDEYDYMYHFQYIDENPKKWLMGKDEYYA